MDYRLLIAGEKDFENYELLAYHAEAVILSYAVHKEIIIFSDAEDGAAMLGERFAAEKGLEVEEFLLQDYNFNAKKAFRAMAVAANACLYFWDGKSVDLKVLAVIAAEEQMKLIVVNYC